MLAVLLNYSMSSTRGSILNFFPGRCTVLLGWLPRVLEAVRTGDGGAAWTPRVRLGTRTLTCDHNLIFLARHNTFDILPYSTTPQLTPPPTQRSLSPPQDSRMGMSCGAYVFPVCMLVQEIGDDHIE